MKKIIVLGSSGMLGNTVFAYLKNKEKYEVKDISRDQFDIVTDSIDKLKFIFEQNVSYVINCAGIIKPRIKTMPVEEVFQVNSRFPIQLSKFIYYLNHKGHNIKLIHISTDCVFTGKIGKYSSEDFPDSLDIYGLSKSLGEACSSNATVIRTSIIGEEINNKYSLLEWAKSKASQEVKGWTDHTWSGVTTLQLAKFIYERIEQGLIYNDLLQYASKPCTKFRLLHMINDAYNLNLKIIQEESGNPCDRSLVPDVEAPSLLHQLFELKTFCENGYK